MRRRNRGWESFIDARWRLGVSLDDKGLLTKTPGRFVPLKKVSMFESAKLKVERAKEHVGDLENAFRRFIQTDPQSLSIGNDPHTGAITVEVRLREAIPSALSLILGDAIHNLRTALDHVTWELIGLDGGTQDRQTAFPFSKTLADYEATCNGINTPRDDTKKFFLSLAAYEGGAGEKLYGLNKLDNADKHRFLTPVIGVASIGHLKVVAPNGVTVMTLKNTRFGMGPDGYARMMSVGHGLSVQLDKDSHPSLDIFFGDVEFFKAMPLIETLMELSDSIAHTIGQFQSFVSNRK